ncbi:unnamed protein product [Cercospora beticola]|nr:unnamed protein product [Cercospora beticola]
MRFDTALATLALAGAGVSAAPLDRRTAEALAAIVGSPNLDGSGPVGPWFPEELYNSPGPNGENRDAVEALPSWFGSPGLIQLPGYGSSTGSQGPSLQQRQVDLEGWAKSNPFSELGNNFGRRSPGEQKRHVGPQEWPDSFNIGDFPRGNLVLASAEKRALIGPQPFDHFQTPTHFGPRPQIWEKRDARLPGATIPPSRGASRIVLPGGPFIRPEELFGDMKLQQREAYPQEWLGRPRVPVPKTGGRLAVCGLYIGEC